MRCVVHAPNLYMPNGIFKVFLVKFKGFSTMGNVAAAS